MFWEQEDCSLLFLSLSLLFYFAPMILNLLGHSSSESDENRGPKQCIFTCTQANTHGEFTPSLT